jgi:hypothetical protein
MRFWPVALCLLALAACGPDPVGPEKAVQDMYAPYVEKNAAGQANWYKSPRHSDRLKTKIDTAIGYGNMLNEPVLDFDPMIWGQGGEVSNLKLKRTAETDETAHVVATFDLSGEPRTVEYDLTRGETIWQINAIKSGGEDLSTLIDNELKPAGDAKAMTAPVEQVYAKYVAAQGKAQPPLHGWAPLSTSFGALLRQAAMKRVPLASDQAGYDPVLAGQPGEIKIVNYQAARSAVLVRFTRAGGIFTVIYPLIQEDGAWKIDNIRFMGSYQGAPAWDVREKLAAAGVK